MDENTESSSNRQTTEERVTITLHDCPIPIDEDERTEELNALKKTLTETLGGSIDHTDIATTVGHHYVQIGDDCPCCGSSLELRDFTYAGNGAVAEANCSNNPSCSWRGRAIYRLVDLGQRSDGSDSTAVADGDATPSYIPY